MVSSTEKELKRRLSRVIKGDDAEKFSSWQPPEMDGTLANHNTIDPSEMAQSAAASKSIEDITKEAYDAGFKQGLNEGNQAGLAQQQGKIAQIDALITALRSKSEEFDEQVTQQLVELTTIIAKHVLRKELSTSPEAIAAIVQEVISMMPANSEQVVLRLHPEDAAIIRDVYEINENNEPTWKIFEDPSIQQGGCILSSENSEINAELDQRIATVVNRLLGASKADD